MHAHLVELCVMLLSHGLARVCDVGWLQISSRVACQIFCVIDVAVSERR
jgi:hypothetical protein